MMMKRDVPWFLLYALGFLLILEWIRPLEQLTETGHIEIFIIFLILSFLLSFIKLKWFWQMLVKMVNILASIYRFYYNEGFFDAGWVASFLTDVKNNSILVVTWDLQNLSDGFRTLLFFSLLWIMVYLIQYWLLRRQRIFIFFFMTLVYITVLDTFTPYDATFAIVRTVAAGFAVMGMLTFYRIMQKENVNQDSSYIRKWMVPLAGMIAFSVLVGFAAPKHVPFWPDPVPYFTSASEKYTGGTGSGEVKRIGYGANDTRLGGPFIGDNHPVFKVEASGKNYWKVETKDVYTGKGWLPSGSTPIQFRQADLVPVYSIPPAVDTIQETATVSFANQDSPLFIYPAGIQKILDTHPKYPAEQLINIDTTTEKVTISKVADYTVAFEIPNYKASDLTKTNVFDPSEMNTEFYQRYTSLPEGLPPRIKQLTEQITAEQTNWFDKAKAVERYFGNPEFTYDQKNVALPGEKDDYVDQFLFETKRGYCDNFSSAMAVMLRTVGIPTRWVKGFTGGEFFEYSQNDSSKQVYHITNNNAHSWVEVFIPTQGWVPFEPTKGFSNDMIMNYSTDTQTPANTQQTAPVPLKKPQKEEAEATRNQNDAKKTSSSKSIWQIDISFAKGNWFVTVLALLLFSVIAGIFYRIRGKWLPYGILMVYRFKRKDESIGAAYLVLLKQLNRYGLKRKENQTLRSYARYIDSFFATREMTHLTSIYEEYLYHRHIPNGVWKETYKLWENLIKRTIA